MPYYAENYYKAVVVMVIMKKLYPVVSIKKLSNNSKRRYLNATLSQNRSLIQHNIEIPSSTKRDCLTKVVSITYIHLKEYDSGKDNVNGNREYWSEFLNYTPVCFDLALAVAYGNFFQNEFTHQALVDNLNRPVNSKVQHLAYFS